MSILGELRRDPVSCRDNLKLCDIDLAMKELSYYKRAGGESVVDTTPEGAGRNPIGLRTISLETGIKIIAGCGFYTDSAQPPRVRSMTEDEIAEEIENDITDGMAGTEIKAGIIGEIGTGWPITLGEEKVLRGAARAHQRTKAAISVHPWPFGKFSHHRILDIMEDEGVELSKVVLCHIDESSVPLDVEYHKSLAKRAVYVEYDTWGSEYHYDGLSSSMGYEVGDPSDNQRIDALVEMIECGYVAQMLLSHDICLKTALRQYGGYGYDHLLTHIVPMLKRRGVTQDHLNQMTIENPRRVLAF